MVAARAQRGRPGFWPLRRLWSRLGDGGSPAAGLAGGINAARRAPQPFFAWFGRLTNLELS